MNLPLYKATIQSWDDGIANLSLVEEPANEHDLQLFSKDKAKLKFEAVSEERHLALALIMSPDTPIYRREYDYEYFITFSKETLAEMAERMVTDGWAIGFDKNHDNKFMCEIKLQQVFLKDSTMGLLPVGFDDVPDGSLMCVLHLNNIEAWEALKNGELKGLSLEGYFTCEPVVSEEEQEILDMIEQLKNKTK